MGAFERALDESGLFFRNLRETSVSKEDYQISAASFLVMRGEYEKALSLFETLAGLDEKDKSFVAHMKGICNYNLGRDAEAKALFEQADEGIADTLAGFYLGCLLRRSPNSNDQIKGYSLIRRAAFLSNLAAMNVMGNICHDNLGLVNTQDRKQEWFWREEMIKLLKKFSNSVRNHALNKAERKYDQFFSKEEIESDLALATALANTKTT